MGVKDSYPGATKQEDAYRSGFLTLVGRPNAGKSSLINAVFEKKIAITSDTVQTTRCRLRAILSRPGFQLIMVDTPGLHKPQDPLGQRLNETAFAALDGVDVVAFLVDASKPVGTGDKWVASHLAQVKAKKIAVLSKSDLVDEEGIKAQSEALAALGEWEALLSLSSLTGEGVAAFTEHVVSLLPPGPRWFPEDMESDLPLEMTVAEFIREKVLRKFFDEIPHAVGVVTEEMGYDARADRYSIYTNIFVERESQKGMIIGKHGASIKEIGSLARLDLEQLLGCKVFLELRVKVKKNWRRDLNQIQRFGYGEGFDAE